MPTINLKQRSVKPNRVQKLDSSGCKYYNSLNWIRLRDSKLMDKPICEICNKVLAESVHHIKPFLTGLNESEIYFLFNDWNNLKSVCNECHNQIHKELNMRKHQ